MNAERKRRAYELIKAARELLHSAWPILPTDDVKAVCDHVDALALKLDSELRN